MSAQELEATRCTRPPRDWEPCALPAGHDTPCRPTRLMPDEIEPPPRRQPWPLWADIVLIVAAFGAYAAAATWVLVTR